MSFCIPIILHLNNRYRDTKEVLDAFEGFTVHIDAKNKTNEKISEEIVVWKSFLLVIYFLLSDYA